jgi:hypothetical protein
MSRRSCTATGCGFCGTRGSDGLAARPLEIAARIASPGCGMLVAGGFCYGRLRDDGAPLVSRKIHRLLRVPPPGSSASGVAGASGGRVTRVAGAASVGIVAWMRRAAPASGARQAGSARKAEPGVTTAHRLLRVPPPGSSASGAALCCLEKRSMRRSSASDIWSDNAAIFAIGQPGSAEARRAWRISPLHDDRSATGRRAKSSREETSAVPAVIAPDRSCCTSTESDREQPTLHSQEGHVRRDAGTTRAGRGRRRGAARAGHLLSATRPRRKD